MNNPYIDQLAEHLKDAIDEGRLRLNDKNTIDYDLLLMEIYNFAMITDRKDKASPGNRPEAFRIACSKLIEHINNSN